MLCSGLTIPGRRTAFDTVPSTLVSFSKSLAHTVCLLGPRVQLWL